MKTVRTNNSGMTLIELLIAISLLGFFALFMPKVFHQTALLSKKASVRSEFDRLQQIMMISVKNITSTKEALKSTLGPALYDELHNCFGQIGPGQTAIKPGINCNQKFSTNPTGWADLKWPNEGSVLNKEWSAQGECSAEASECLMKTWIKYFISCNSTRCFSVNILMGITPTAAMMAKKDEGVATSGFSVSDFKEKRFQTSMPATMFGLSGNVIQRPCDNYVSNFDFNYMALLCDPSMGSPSCGTSLSSFNDKEASCEITGQSIFDGKAFGSIQPGSIDITKDNSKVLIKITARAEGIGDNKPVLDPETGNTLIKPIPLFDSTKRDKIVINCPPPIGEHPGSTNPYTLEIERNLSGYGHGSKISCNFYVTTEFGSVKGGEGKAVIMFYDPGATGGGDDGSGPINNPPPGTGGGGGSGDIDNNEV